MSMATKPLNTLELLRDYYVDEGVHELEDIKKIVTSNADVMDGLPVFVGTRIPVYIVLDYIAEGYKESDIINDYPSLDEGKIRTALKFAEMLSSLH